METLALPFTLPRLHPGFDLEFRIEHAPNAAIGCWRGRAASATPEEVARQARRLLERPRDRVVLDLEHVTAASRDIVDVFANAVLAAQRFGQPVVLLRCPEELYRELRFSGMRGNVGHAASLSAATDGLAGRARTWEVHLRSEEGQLLRLQRVLAAISRDACLSDEAEMRVQTAAKECVANAIRHGSPLGVRNHVRISMSLEDECLWVDVTDQGAGFDPYSILGEAGDISSERGTGLRLMRSLAAQVQFYRAEGGMLVRLKHYCR